MTYIEFMHKLENNKDFRDEVFVFSKKILSIPDNDILNKYSRYQDALELLAINPNTTDQEWHYFYYNYKFTFSDIDTYYQIMSYVFNSYIQSPETTESKESVNYYRHDNAIVFDSDKITYPYPTRSQTAQVLSENKTKEELQSAIIQSEQSFSIQANNYTDWLSQNNLAPRSTASIERSWSVSSKHYTIQDIINIYKELELNKFADTYDGLMRKIIFSEISHLLTQRHFALYAPTTPILFKAFEQILLRSFGINKAQKIEIGKKLDLFHQFNTTILIEKGEQEIIKQIEAAKNDADRIEHLLKLRQFTLEFISTIYTNNNIIILEKLYYQNIQAVLPSIPLDQLKWIISSETRLTNIDKSKIHEVVSNSLIQERLQIQQQREQSELQYQLVIDQMLTAKKQSLYTDIKLQQETNEENKSKLIAAKRDEAALIEAKRQELAALEDQREEALLVEEKNRKAALVEEEKRLDEKNLDEIKRKVEEDKKEVAKLAYRAELVKRARGYMFELFQDSEENEKYGTRSARAVEKEFRNGGVHVDSWFYGQVKFKKWLFENSRKVYGAYESDPFVKVSNRFGDLYTQYDSGFSVGLDKVQVDKVTKKPSWYGNLSEYLKTENVSYQSIEDAVKIMDLSAVKGFGAVEGVSGDSGEVDAREGLEQELFGDEFNEFVDSLEKQARLAAAKTKYEMLNRDFNVVEKQDLYKILLRPLTFGDYERLRIEGRRNIDERIRVNLKPAVDEMTKWKKEQNVIAYHEVKNLKTMFLERWEQDNIDELRAHQEFMKTMWAPNVIKQMNDKFYQDRKAIRDNDWIDSPENKESKIYWKKIVEVETVFREKIKHIYNEFDEIYNKFEDFMLPVDFKTGNKSYEKTVRELLVDNEDAFYSKFGNDVGWKVGHVDSNIMSNLDVYSYQVIADMDFGEITKEDIQEVIESMSKAELVSHPHALFDKVWKVHRFKVLPNEVKQLAYLFATNFTFNKEVFDREIFNNSLEKAMVYLDQYVYPSKFRPREIYDSFEEGTGKNYQVIWWQGKLYENYNAFRIAKANVKAFEKGYLETCNEVIESAYDSCLLVYKTIKKAPKKQIDKIFGGDVTVFNMSDLYDLAVDVGGRVIGESDAVVAMADSSVSFEEDLVSGTFEGHFDWVENEIKGFSYDENLGGLFSDLVRPITKIVTDPFESLWDKVSTPIEEAISDISNFAERKVLHKIVPDKVRGYFDPVEDVWKATMTSVELVAKAIIEGVWGFPDATEMMLSKSWDAIDRALKHQPLYDIRVKRLQDLYSLPRQLAENIVRDAEYAGAKIENAGGDSVKVIGNIIDALPVEYVEEYIKRLANLTEESFNALAAIASGQCSPFDIDSEGCKKIVHDWGKAAVSFSAWQAMPAMKISMELMQEVQGMPLVGNLIRSVDHHTGLVSAVNIIEQGTIDLAHNERINVKAYLLSAIRIGAAVAAGPWGVATMYAKNYVFYHSGVDRDSALGWAINIVIDGVMGNVDVETLAMEEFTREAIHYVWTKEGWANEDIAQLALTALYRWEDSEDEALIESIYFTAKDASKNLVRHKARRKLYVEYLKESTGADVFSDAVLDTWMDDKGFTDSLQKRADVRLEQEYTEKQALLMNSKEVRKLKLDKALKLYKKELDGKELTYERAKQNSLEAIIDFEEELSRLSFDSVSWGSAEEGIQNDLLAKINIEQDKLVSDESFWDSFSSSFLKNIDDLASETSRLASELAGGLIDIPVKVAKESVRFADDLVVNGGKAVEALVEIPEKLLMVTKEAIIDIAEEGARFIEDISNIPDKLSNINFGDGISLSVGELIDKLPSLDSISIGDFGLDDVDLDFSLGLDSIGDIDFGFDLNSPDIDLDWFKEMYDKYGDLFLNFLKWLYGDQWRERLDNRAKFEWGPWNYNNLSQKQSSGKMYLGWLALMAVGGYLVIDKDKA